jgi:serine/threonine protein kinase
VAANGRWLLGGFGWKKDGVESGTLQECNFTFSSDDMSQMSPDPSLRYCAPEISDGYPGKCGCESDVFSLGLIVFELLSNERKPLLGAVRELIIYEGIDNLSKDHDILVQELKALS